MWFAKGCRAIKWLSQDQDLDSWIQSPGSQPLLFLSCGRCGQWASVPWWLCCFLCSLWFHLWEYLHKPSRVESQGVYFTWGTKGLPLKEHTVGRKSSWLKDCPHVCLSSGFPAAPCGNMAETERGCNLLHVKMKRVVGGKAPAWPPVSGDGDGGRGLELSAAAPCPVPTLTTLTVGPVVTLPSTAGWQFSRKHQQDPSL